MTVYYALVALLLLFGLLLRGGQKGNTKFILVAVALMFCVYGLRDTYSIGIDNTSSYLKHFERMEHTGWEDLPKFKDWIGLNDNEEEQKESHTRNIAFEWLLKIGYDWTDGDYQLFVSAISLFVMIVFAHFVRRYSVSPIQSILLYFGLLFFTFNFSALKQSVAMAFVMLSMDAVVDRKLFRFLILTTVASMLHFPSLVFLPAYWIGNMKLGRTYLIFLFILFLLTYYFRDQILEWMTDAYDTEIKDTGRSFLANKVIIMLIIIGAALIIRPPRGDHKLYNALLMFMGIAAVIQTFSSYNNTFERLADYYFQFAVVFIPMVFEDVKLSKRHLSERELKMVCKVGPYLFCTFAIWRFLNYAQNPDALISPYQFYFQAEKAAEELLTWRFL